MSWMEQRANFQQRLDALNGIDVVGTIFTPLDQALAIYISKGGVGADVNTNKAYQDVITYSQKADNLKLQYLQLNKDILAYVETEATHNNLSDLLIENGELQNKIQRLSKIQDEIKVDVDSAVARDELLRSRDTVTTPHTLFLLDRPVRQGMIPYLWVISILFIGVGLIIVKMMAPSLSFGMNSYGQPASFLVMLTAFFANRTVLISLLVAAAITILFLALKVGGLLGK